ncbi:glutamate--cysteine ligase [Umezawaea sp. Da 62-37]|uniref:carboxylate-amine ligase n=1 Tax=Umezawaea sp. Da 62-37 TaxID=3075927 RepID=UPI0028F70530|nr:glutamate--cysteine ligase [Umezawaea sp. Da 62-37]WNV89380.1 glutamate--cysteine ligase [Umezawaea sp. Da 62-37]
MTSLWTVGVEQELFLVDPETRRPVPLAQRVVEEAGDGFDVQRELTPFQIEVATPVCETPGELVEQIRAGREHLAKAARAAGCRLMAAAIPPLGKAGPPPETDDPRYRLMEHSHRKLLGGQGVCGCHVHVGVPDQETAIHISNAIRPWLPTLLALTVNSPVMDTEDTGYASWRAMIWSRWPVGGAPPHFESAAHYELLVKSLIDSEALLDKGMVYWDIRPSANHPTIEVRVADLPLTVREVAVFAELVRALAATAVADPPQDEPVDPVLLRAAAWRAARDGIDGLGVDVRTGALVPAHEQAAKLVAYTSDALREVGQLSTVEEHLEWLRVNGSAAARQRRALKDDSDPRALVDRLVDWTLE